MSSVQAVYVYIVMGKLRFQNNAGVAAKTIRHFHCDTANHARGHSEPQLTPKPPTPHRGGVGVGGDGDSSMQQQQ